MAECGVRPTGMNQWSLESSSSDSSFAENESLRVLSVLVLAVFCLDSSSGSTTGDPANTSTGHGSFFMFHDCSEGPFDAETDPNGSWTLARPVVLFTNGQS